MRVDPDDKKELYFYCKVVSELSIIIITYNVMLTQMEGVSIIYAWEDQAMRWS